MYLQSALVCIILCVTCPTYGQVLIVNGQNAALGQFPYAASLQYENSHFCGGSIIAANWIVTAAHCGVNFVNNVESLAVLVGTITLSSGGTHYNVSNIIIHENYGSGLFHIRNDIALIKLTTSITFNTNTGPIPLATSTPRSGTRATAIGWGLNEEGVIPNQLQFVNVTTVSFISCVIRNFPLLPLGPQICAVADTNGAGICNGDSGSALIYRNTLIGIVSWGTGGCANGRPDGYVNVAGYRRWILNNMSNN